jgi:hypothetical protein
MGDTYNDHPHCRGIPEKFHAQYEFLVLWRQNLGSILSLLCPSPWDSHVLASRFLIAHLKTANRKLNIYFRLQEKNVHLKGPLTLL